MDIQKELMREYLEDVQRDLGNTPDHNAGGAGGMFQSLNAFLWKSLFSDDDDDDNDNNNNNDDDDDDDDDS